MKLSYRAPLALAACVLVPVAVALAGPTKTSTIDIDSGENGTATATCPAGKSVGVGGFRATVGEPQGTLVSALLPKGRSWQASATDLGEPGELSAIAYCANKPELERKRRSVDVPGESVASVTATCPQGKTVQLGGFELDGPAVADGDGELRGLKRVSPRRWKATAGNTDVEALELTAIAGCANRPAPAAKAKTVTTVNGNTSARAKCPEGKRVAFGGFSLAPRDDGGNFVKALRRPSARTWKATAFEFAADGSKSLTAIAYCG